MEIIVAFAAILALGFLNLALSLPPKFLRQVDPDDNANTTHKITNGKVYR